MKKRNLITMTAGLVLMGAVGAGATLAYLSDSTGPLTNTFTFAENGIRIKLDEGKVDENNRIEKDGDGNEIRTDEGNHYRNIIPGLTVAKDPTVTVEAGSLNCNVFVSVTNANQTEYLKIDDLNTDAWQQINPEDYDLNSAADTTYYVYRGRQATGSAESGDEFAVVAKSDADIVLEDVFTTVTFGADIKEEDMEEAENNGKNIFSDMIIKAAAVQSDSCADADAAKTALGMLGAAEKSAQ